MVPLWLKLLNASEPEVIKRPEALLDPYGSQAAYGRAAQTSDADLDRSLEMLKNMTQMLPPVFLLVTAFPLGLTLSRVEMGPAAGRRCGRDSHRSAALARKALTRTTGG